MGASSTFTVTSGLPGSFVSVGKLNQPKRSVTSTAWAADAAPVFGSLTWIEISKGWMASRRSVDASETATLCSAIVPWVVRRTSYAPAAVQACEGAGCVAEAPSPKSQSHDDPPTADVSRSEIACPATGFGGSTTNVTVGAAPARASQKARSATAGRRIERERVRDMSVGKDRGRPHGRPRRLTFL